jgi:hypothetical protein
MDQDLAVLSQRLEHSFIPYGPQDNPETEAETSARPRLSDSIAADRAAFVAARGRLGAGRVDLVEALDAGSFTASDIDPTLLPSRFRSMTQIELHEHLAEIRNDRVELRALISDLLAERRTVLTERGSDDAAGFDRIVAETVRLQMLRARSTPGG